MGVVKCDSPHLVPKNDGGWCGQVDVDKWVWSSGCGQVDVVGCWNTYALLSVVIVLICIDLDMI